MHPVQNSTLLALFLFLLNGTELNHDSNIFSGSKKASINNILDISRFRNITINGYKYNKYFEDIDDNYNIGKFYYDYLVSNNFISPTDLISSLQNIFIHSINSSQSIESVLSFLNGFLYNHAGYIDQNIDIKTNINESEVSNSELIINNIYEKLEQFQNFSEKPSDKVLNLFSEDNQTISLIISEILLSINGSNKSINSPFSIEIWKQNSSSLIVRILSNTKIIYESQLELFKLSFEYVKFKLMIKEKLVNYINKCKYYIKTIDSFINTTKKHYDLINDNFDKIDSFVDISLRKISKNKNHQNETKEYTLLMSSLLEIKDKELELLDVFSDNINNHIKAISSFIEQDDFIEYLDENYKAEYDKINNDFHEKLKISNYLLQRYTYYKSLVQSRYDEWIKKITKKLDLIQ